MDLLAISVARRFARRMVATHFAYHGTTSAVMPRIAKHGLITGAMSSYGDSYSEYDDGNHLFFTDNPENVRHSYGDVILRFPWPSDAQPDMNKYGRILAHQFVSKLSVSPTKIEFETDGKWQSLAPSDKSSDKPTYTGVFLDESSQRRLLDWWMKHTNTQLLGTTHADHMTIKYEPTAEELKKTPLGQKIMMRVIGWAADEKGQAVMVQPKGLSSANAHPHITVATAPGTGGVYSNELLAKGSNRVSGPTLAGVVDAR